MNSIDLHIEKSWVEGFFVLEIGKNYNLAEPFFGKRPWGRMIETINKVQDQTG